VIRLDDPALVAAEYSNEARLRARVEAQVARKTGMDTREPAVAAVVEAAPRRVLEVGCGWGELAEWIGRATGAEVIAVDLSSRMVDLARERGVDSRLGDVQDLQFDDGEFDVAVAAWMLYHVPDLAAGIAELARVLRPGGRLVAITNSALHLEELRALVGSGPSPASFTRETGEELLRVSFVSVRRIDVDGAVEFADRAEVEAYIRSSIAMSPFVDNLPPVVAEPFVARSASSVFVAEKAS
jgi:SAM-dependent methyltransferase